MRFIKYAIIILILLNEKLFYAQLQNNLLKNGGFEQGFLNWDNQAILDSTIYFSGKYSARFKNSTGLINQIVYVEPYAEYKVSFWVYLDSSFSGNDWGGASVSITDYFWNYLGGSIYINPDNRSKEKWHPIIFKFNSGSSNIVRLSAGFFGGNGWKANFNLDEIKLFKKNLQNIKPKIVSFQANPTQGTAPLSVDITLSGSDDDGIIEGHYLEISDGSYYEGDNVKHIFYLQGVYKIKAILKDDDNDVAIDEKIILVESEQNNNLNLSINAPFTGYYYETSHEDINIQGTITGQIQTIFWFNEKNHQNGFANIEANNFSFKLPLSYGKNFLILQAKLFNNSYYKKEYLIFRKSENYSGPELVNYSILSRNIKTFEKFEIHFELNTIADNNWFPYEDNLPPNLNTGKGVTVEGIFTKGNKKLVFPAFYDMPYERQGNNLLPLGYYIWKIRASFDEPGEYEIQIRAADSLGEKNYSLGKIFIEKSSKNKGFLKVSKYNDKYFEFTNGNSFFPLGFNDGVDKADLTDQKIRVYSENGINMLRVWLSSISQFSDPWCSWSTHHKMEDNGYMNPPLYRFNRKYKNGDFSVRIAAPAIPNINTPAAFRGFYDGGNIVKPNTNYRVTLRVKLENVVAKEGGFSVKISGWAGEDIVKINSGNRIIGPLTGSTDWILLSGEYKTKYDETELPFLYVVLEGDAKGEVYIDMILLQEIFANGKLSANIISKWSSNPHLYFDPIKCRYFDYFVDKATNNGVYLKTVILEKNDYILNRIDASGMPSSQNGNFDAPKNSKLRRLYEYYWRNLIARWGYSDAIHSWELVNEGAPGSYKELTDEFSDYFDKNSPHKHMTTTSFWALWLPEYWSKSKSDYADVHSYVNSTGFIDTATFLGIHYNRTKMQNDPAAMINIYSKFIGNDTLRNKPVIIGEIDLDTPEGINPDPALSADHRGIWLKGFLWGHLNSGGAAGLLWDPVNIREKNLFHIYKSVSNFFSQIKFNKYKFKEPNITISNLNIQGWGISDLEGKQIYFYARHKNFYWRNILDNGLPSAQLSNFNIKDLIPGNYVIKIYNPDDLSLIDSLFINLEQDNLYLRNVYIDDHILISAVNASLLNFDNNVNIKKDFILYQNYPNPFNSQTNIAFELPEQGEVIIKIYNSIGQLLENIFLKNLSKGKNVHVYSPNNLKSGVYLAKVVYKKKFRIIKMIYLK